MTARTCVQPMLKCTCTCLPACPPARSRARPLSPLCQVEEYIAAMERIKIKEGIRLAMAISADGNKFLQVGVGVGVGRGTGGSSARC